MELILSKLQSNFDGFDLSIKHDSQGTSQESRIQTVARINGNHADYCGPVVVLNIDQYVVYSLSQPEVVSRILTKGQQQLLTTKETAHNLFEHGMKASLGKLKIKTNWFLTTLETFYSCSLTGHCLEIIQGNKENKENRENKIGCLVSPSPEYQNILICNYGFDYDKVGNIGNISSVIEIDSIRTYVTMPFKLK